MRFYLDQVLKLILHEMNILISMILCFLTWYPSLSFKFIPSFWKWKVIKFNKFLPLSIWVASEDSYVCISILGQFNGRFTLVNLCFFWQIFLRINHIIGSKLTYNCCRFGDVFQKRLQHWNHIAPFSQLHKRDLYPSGFKQNGQRGSYAWSYLKQGFCLQYSWGRLRSLIQNLKWDGFWLGLGKNNQKSNWTS